MRKQPRLTIGMATYDDFHGVYFTIQALRLYHDLTDVELLVVDTGSGKVSEMLQGLLANAQPGNAGARYVHAPESAGTQPSRDRLFREARGEAVMSLDCHVLLAPGAVEKLLAWYDAHPDSRDLLTGPMLMDNLRSMATIYQDFWRGGNWGIWGLAWEAPDGTRYSVQDEGGKAVFVRLGMGRELIDLGFRLPFANHERHLSERGHKLLGLDPADEFEIPGMGVGLFTCRREAWLGFHPLATEFGADELYIHEKFRQAGHQCLSLGFLKWVHRFGRPEGPQYPRSNYAKARNYVLEFNELGRPLDDVYRHLVLEERVLTQADWEWLTADPENHKFPQGRTTPLQANAVAVDVDMVFRAMHKATGRDLNQHMPMLARFASQCKVVAEVSGRKESTVAFASVKGLEKIVSFNGEASDGALQAVAKLTPALELKPFRLPEFPAIPPCDLLFLDTEHTGARLSAEFAQYAEHVARFIVIHDTTIYGEKGTDGQPGLAHAVRAFVEDNPAWFVAGHTTAQHGLTVLSRHPEDRPPREIRIWQKGYGPGTELTAMIEQLGVTAPPNCSCKKTAREMDHAGVEGCRRDRATIIEALEKNYAKMGVFDRLKNVASAVANAPTCGFATKLNPLDLWGSLVDEAIRRAAEKEATA